MTSLREYTDDLRTFTDQLDPAHTTLEHPERAQGLLEGYQLALQDLQTIWRLTPHWNMQTALPDFAAQRAALQETLAQRCGLAPVGAAAGPPARTAATATPAAGTVPETTTEGAALPRREEPG